MLKVAERWRSTMSTKQAPPMKGSSVITDLRGVATTLGVFLALSPILGALCCVIWLLVAFLLRFSSLAALVSIASAPLLSWFLLGDLQMVELTAVLTLLVWIRHHENIRRLLTGREPKIGRKKD